MSDNSGSNRRPPQRGLHTLRDLQGDANPPQGRGAGGRSDDADDDSDDQDFFAGGEKSGLAVQNPGNPQDQINTLLDRARRNIRRPGGEDAAPTSSHFTGVGQTLGGDDTPSETIPDPAALIPPPPQRATRTLHLWQEGFSVDDGELHRYDDPNNQRTLELINSGRAPLDVLNVKGGQEVDLQVHQHRGEKYKAPQKKYRPFSGDGQRLGSPVPGAASSVPSSSAPAAAPPHQQTHATSANASASAQASAPSIQIDDSEPTVMLQIRLGDGTRLQSRFNASHTVGDVYDFVDAASAASRERPYALMTTFPSTELVDRSAVLGEMAEFKRGGVVVQKWK